MIKHLKISNYALIDTVEISFDEGLTIITGETGAGKSIIMGALSLLLGQRADVKAIRHADKKSIIEASFCIEGYGLDNFFTENDIDSYDTECLLRRELLPNGRTRAFVNDTPVTLAVLSALAIRLVDIHSQHSNALLLNPSYQLKVIDSLADNSDVRNDYAEKFANYSKLSDELKQLRERIQKNKDNEDYLRFQLSQLSPLNLNESEQEELEATHKLLSNIGEVKEKVWESCNLLGESNNSILNKLNKVQTLLEQLSDVFEPSAEYVQRLESAAIELQDIYENLNGHIDEMHDDPDELEKVEARLNAIYSLEKRYHVNTVGELIAIEKDLEKSLKEIDNSEEQLEELQSRLDEQTKVLKAAAERLTRTRESAAEIFASKLETVAKPLGMKNLQCRVDFQQQPFGKSGCDAIVFLFAFNKNQQLVSAEKTASGGELSRLMLCIKSIIAEKMQLPSIIFDEVDTGVSGEVANKIGEMMKGIASTIQVISITHLPQVAALGAHHFKVFKQDIADSTVTNIKKLDNQGRILEIAQMLSGERVDNAAINNAKSLLKLS